MPRGGVVCCLTGREHRGDRANPAIDEGMDFGGQPAPGATYSVIIRFGNLVIRQTYPPSFFGRHALGRCELRQRSVCLRCVGMVQVDREDPA